MLEPTLAWLQQRLTDTQYEQLANYCTKAGATLEAIYPYCEGNGNMQFLVFRLLKAGEKTFRIGHFNGNQLVFKKPAKPAAGFTLYGGLLPARYPDATIVVCEGEKATLALNQFLRTAGGRERFAAVTSGGAKSANAADWSVLTGRQVWIWPDRDAPGDAYAREVERRLRDLAATVAVIDVERLGLPPSGDAADWVTTHTEPSVSAIEALPLTPVTGRARSASRDQSSALSDASAPFWDHTALTPVRASQPPDADISPLPLFREVGERQAFPAQALGPLLNDAAAALAQAVQCPLVIAANAVLAASAVVVQGRINVLVDGRLTSTSLYLLTLAPSGERKSSVDTLAMAPLYAYQKASQARYRADLSAYQALCKGLPKGSVRPAEPRDPTLLMQDVTLDAMVRALIEGRPSQALFLSEGGSFLGGYAMSKETLLRTAAFLSSIWSGEPIAQARVARGRCMAYGRRLSIHLQAQPEVAAGFVSNDLLQQQGLLPRFLVAEVESRIGQRFYVRQNIQDDPRYVAYVDRLTALLAIEPVADSAGEIEFGVLTLAPDAYQLWIDAHDAIERASARDGALEHVQAYAAKLAEQILRIAGVITMVEDDAATVISAATMQGAIQLAGYYLQEASRLLTRPEDKQLHQAQVLLEWLQRHHSPIALRDIYRTGPACARTARSARLLIDALIEHGWVTTFTDVITASDGKRSHENYEVRRDV